MTRTTPKPWQPPVIECAVNAMRKRLPFLDASDTGTGKTYTTCFAAAQAGVTLGVVCPISVIPSWIEASEKTGAQFAFVGNIESLKSGKGPLRRLGAHKWAWDVPEWTRLVFDEVHRFKNTTTQNGKILRSARSPIMLSATPFAGPHEAQVIGSALRLFNWHDFVEWAGAHGCKFGELGLEFSGITRGEATEAEKAAARTQILDRIHRQIYHTGRGARIRKADLGDLFPRITRETRLLPVDDPSKIDEAYHDELVRLAGEAPSGAVEYLRARQLSEFSKVPHIIELVTDYVEQGCSVLVFVNFRDTFARLVEAFPGCARIYGGQEEDGVPRESERLRFQCDDARVMVAMIQAGGVALSAHDLNGRHPRVSLILPGLSAEQVIQADGRDHRAGGLTPVHHIYLYCDCETERGLRYKLEQKIDHIETLLDGDLTPA